MVKKEISRLYYSDIAGVALGVVRDMGLPGLVKECCDRLKLKKNSVYFNLGIILYNLPLIRKQWSREQFIQAVYNIQKLNLVYPDQDIINILFESNKMLLVDTWNFQIRSWNKVDESVIDNAAVIHYVGEVKPWALEYGNQTKKIWWKYYSLCDLRGYYMLKMKNIYERYKKCFYRIMRK